LLLLIVWCAVTTIADLGIGGTFLNGVKNLAESIAGYVYFIGIRFQKSNRLAKIGSFLQQGIEFCIAVAGFHGRSYNGKIVFPGCY